MPPSPLLAVLGEHYCEHCWLIQTYESQHDISYRGRSML